MNDGSSDLLTFLTANGRGASATLAPMALAITRSSEASRDTYTLQSEGTALWQIDVDWGEHAHVPFREQLVWESAGVAVLGGGAAVYFLDLATGAVRSRLDLPCRFGHLALDPGEQHLRGEQLYVMGWTDIAAVAPSLEVRWWLRAVAVDGIVFREASGPLVGFGVEMDPPGGWFDIEVDARTGRELARTAAFTPGYRGIYGNRP